MTISDLLATCSGGIVFTGGSVRAIRNGRKTQTRRIATTGHPRCKIGKRYYVKEAWARRLDEDEQPRALLEADPWAWYWADQQTCNTGCAGAAGKRRSALFMPRWAARYVIEIDSSELQRLQDITEEDVRAEGVYTWAEGDHTCNVIETYFAPRWNEINGKRAPWASNPWVWRYTFHLVQP